MRGPEESLALGTGNEGKEGGSRAAAGLWVGEAQAMWIAARSLLYLQ